jgi:hypothetical protein
MAEPSFAYIHTADDCIPVEIDGYKDRDALVGMKGNRGAIYAWLVENTDADELPAVGDIESVDVELEDNEADALAGGNETTEIWDV